jgi:hypothetical protein
LVVVQHRSPAEEADRLAGPGVAVVRVAYEASALLAQLDGGRLGSGSLAATKRRRTPWRDPSSSLTSTTTDELVTPLGPDAGGSADVDESFAVDDDVAVPPPAVEATETDEAPEEVPASTTDDLLLSERRLRAAARNEDRRILATQLYDHQALCDRRDLARTWGPDAVVVPIVAGVVGGYIGSLTLGVALALVAIPVAIAAAVVIWHLNRRIDALDAEIDATDDRIQHLGDGRDDETDIRWYQVLAELGLPPMDHREVDAAIAILEQRAARRRRATRQRRPPTRTGNTAALARQPRSLPVTRAAPVLAEGANVPDLVVVVDDGLHAGHRLAIQEVSRRLAKLIPVLVLTTNDRLW